MNKYIVYREDDIVVKLKHLMPYLSAFLKGVVGVAPMNEWLYIYQLTNKAYWKEKKKILWEDEKEDANWFSIKYFNEVCDNIRTDWLNLYFSVSLEEAQRRTYYLKVACIDGFFWEIHTENNRIIESLKTNEEGLVFNKE